MLRGAHLVLIVQTARFVGARHPCLMNVKHHHWKY
jgi:hypothetical protein